MKPIEISKGIYSVGVIDWNIRNFHGYSTDMGTTYNAYLIVDEKVALIDTVKMEFVDQLIENISQIIDPKKIVKNGPCIISNFPTPKIRTLFTVKPGIKFKIKF